MKQRVGIARADMAYTRSEFSAWTTSSALDSSWQEISRVPRASAARSDALLHPAR